MFKIKLELEPRTYDLENVSYSLSSYADSPDSSAPYKDYVSFTMSIKMNKVDQSFLDWCIGGATLRKDGKITVFDPDRELIVKTLTFKKGYCSALNGSIYAHDDYNSYPMSFTIIAEKLTIQLEKSKGRRKSDDE
jgi:hypothetical protein